MPKTLNRVGLNIKFIKMETKKEALIAQILAEKAASVSGTHCCGGTHCCSTL